MRDRLLLPYGIPMSVGEEDTLKGGDISVFGGSLQGQLNFNRGAKFNPYVAPFWFVAEASWMSGLYDDDASSDDAQFELTGRAGWQFTDRCRIDAGVDYYTEWKQIFAGVGATFSI